MATYLVTGAAGFIASKVCELLLAEKHTVIGVDNLNDYYDVHLKHWRLAQLQAGRGLTAQWRCEAQHAATSASCLPWLPSGWEPRLEVLLLLWDEMDDWLAAARHLLRNLT